MTLKIMDRKRLSPIEKHSARVVIMSFFMLLFIAFVSVIIDSILEYVFHVPAWFHGDFCFGVMIGLFAMWTINVRFGWVENIIEGKKKYPQLSAWFENVSGR